MTGTPHTLVGILGLLLEAIQRAPRGVSVGPELALGHRRQGNQTRQFLGRPIVQLARQAGTLRFLFSRDPAICAAKLFDLLFESGEEKRIIQCRGSLPDDGPEQGQVIGVKRVMRLLGLKAQNSLETGARDQGHA